MKVKSLSRVWLLATPWTAAYKAPPSTGFSRQEYWSGVPLPSPLIWTLLLILLGFPDSTVCKEATCNAGDPGLIPWSVRSAGEGNSYQLQYSGWENSMDCIVHGVRKSWTWLDLTWLPNFANGPPLCGWQPCPSHPSAPRIGVQLERTVRVHASLAMVMGFLAHCSSLSLFSHSVWSDSFATPWTVACQAPLPMGFSRQEYWSGLPFPSPGDLPNPGIELVSPALQECSLPLSHLGSPGTL